MAHVEVSHAAGEVMSPHRRSLAASLDSWLGTLVEIPAALLVVAEIVILFTGVVARYGLHTPLIWSDELASILFLWLAMLGAAVAFRRSEHMRMTAIVANTTPATRAWLDVVATCAALAFLLLIAWPAYEYAHEESFITTPALQIPNVWRAAALPAGVGVMALFALLRLARAGDMRHVLTAVLSVAVVLAVLPRRRGWPGTRSRPNCGWSVRSTSVPRKLGGRNDRQRIFLALDDLGLQRRIDLAEIDRRRRRVEGLEHRRPQR